MLQYSLGAQFGSWVDRMQVKADQISAADGRGSRRGGRPAASTPAAPREAAACEAVAREAATREIGAADSTDSALAAWAQRLASKLVTGLARSTCGRRGRAGRAPRHRIPRIRRAGSHRAARGAIAGDRPIAPARTAIQIGTLTLASAGWRGRCAGRGDGAARVAGRRERASARAAARFRALARGDAVDRLARRAESPGRGADRQRALLRGSLPPDKGDRARRQVEAIQRAGHRINTLIRDLLDFSSIEGPPVAHGASPRGRPAAVRGAGRPTPDRRDQVTGAVGNAGPAQAMTVCCNRRSHRPGVLQRHWQQHQVQPDRRAHPRRRRGRRPGRAFHGHRRRSGHGCRGAVPTCSIGPGRPSARTATGSGSGLAIVRGIVEAHGGRVWAESALGEGTKVHFTLPSA